MKVSRRKVAAAIASSTLKNGVSRKFAKEIGAYLLTDKRTAELDSLLRDVQEIWAEDGSVNVTAISAHPLNPRVKQDINKEVRRVYPHVKHISITPVADPAIIGGVRIEFANQQLDLSVENKLNQFKQLTAAGKE